MWWIYSTAIFAWNVRKNWWFLVNTKVYILPMEIVAPSSWFSLHGTDTANIFSPMCLVTGRGAHGESREYIENYKFEPAQGWWWGWWPVPGSEHKHTPPSVCRGQNSKWGMQQRPEFIDTLENVSEWNELILTSLSPKSKSDPES